MPVTPFHFGAGLLAKGLLPRRVSFVGFCLTQVAIDCESGYFLFRGEWPAHRFFHTVLGASLLCLGTCLLLMPLVSLVPSRLAKTADVDLSRWLALSAPLTWSVLLATALLGVLGHIIPDGIMHSDIQPFSPFTELNPMHELIPVGALHIALVIAGGIGWFLIAARRSKSTAA